MSKKVVFFFPSFASSDATAPLGILAVATPLLRAGYSIQLIDSTITPNYKKRVLEEVQDALCLGISLVTGPNPDFPVILGGWHPSLLPKQTLEADYIDIVVKGQGEDALLDVVQHLESRSALDLVPGIGFKRDKKLIFTSERPLRPIVESPPRGFRRVRAGVRPAMGDAHLESGVPVQLLVLHERRRLRPQVERAIRGAVCGGDRRSDAPLRSGASVGGRRQLSGGSRPRAADR